jgi:hypothetical protein
MTVSNNCDGPAVRCQFFIKAHQLFSFWGLNSTRGQKKRQKKELMNIKRRDANC